MTYFEASRLDLAARPDWASHRLEKESKALITLEAVCMLPEYL